MPENSVKAEQTLRHDWTVEEVEKLYNMPFADLMFQSQTVHREYFDPNSVQVSTLLSIKTGGCAEDCGYCPQSAHHESAVKAEPLMPLDRVLENATKAKESGASRFCMGAAWRNLKDRDLERVAAMVTGVKDLGLETCVTLGMLEGHQAKRLKEAGLDFYNHNLDTSPEFYGDIISTRTYQDRLDTLDHVRDADIHVCSGGIVGMGESLTDRAGLLVALANLPDHPQSVPINLLVQVEGTPMAETDNLDPLMFVRTIAVARLMMPESYVRLSAGREHMSDELQAMCFLAGANSIFYGEKLLTTDNPDTAHDQQLFERLGINTLSESGTSEHASAA
ncbi:MAG: biotin synthase BioB [Piscirickettsiaceae bacterium]|jgi:biotin synthase|nr:biotin synthase BioB [Piscirickettsiaceae bacterium]